MLSVKDVRMLFPKELEDMLNFEETDKYIVIRLPPYFGSENFAKIASIVRDASGEYISAGKESHFRVAREIRLKVPMLKAPKTEVLDDENVRFDASSYLSDRGEVHEGVHEGLTFVEGIVIFLFSPIAAIVAWLIWHDDEPSKANEAIAILIIELILGFLIFIFIFFSRPY